MNRFLTALQRDFVTNWPRDWEDASHPLRLGFQAGVNRALGSDAVHTRKYSQHDPYSQPSANSEAWRLGYSNGLDHAVRLLAEAELEQQAHAIAATSPQELRHGG